MLPDSGEGTIIPEEAREAIFGRIQSAYSVNHLFQIVNQLQHTRKMLHLIHPEIHGYRVAECAAPPVAGAIGYALSGQWSGILIGLAGVPLSIIAQMAVSDFGALVKKEFAPYMRGICEKADNLQPRNVKWNSRDIMSDYYKWHYPDPVHRGMAYVEKVMEDFFSCVNFSKLYIPHEGGRDTNPHQRKIRPKDFTS